MRSICTNEGSSTITISRTRIDRGVILELDYLFRKHPYINVTLIECQFLNPEVEVDLYHQLTASKVVVVKCIRCGRGAALNRIGVSLNLAMLLTSPDTKVRFLQVSSDFTPAEIETFVEASCSGHSVLESLSVHLSTAEASFESLYTMLLDPACALRNLGLVITFRNREVSFDTEKLRAVVADPRCKLQTCHMHRVVCKSIIANRALEAVLEQFADAPDENWLPPDIIRQIGTYLRDDTRNCDGLDPKFAV